MPKLRRVTTGARWEPLETPFCSVWEVEQRTRPGRSPVTSVSRCQVLLSACWHGLEAPLDQIGIVELTSPDKCGGMPPPFPHGAGTLNTEWPCDQPLAPIGAGHNASRSKSASCTIRSRNRSQLTVIRHRVVRAIATNVRMDVDQIVASGCHANDNALRRLDHRYRSWHKRPFDVRIRWRNGAHGWCREEHVVAAAKMNGVI